jgi:Uma2 family endonuclease
MPVAERLITADDLLAMEDTGLRLELEQGVLLAGEPPGAVHGLVVAAVAAVLWAHLERTGEGVVLAGDPGFRLTRSPDTVRAPDVAIILAPEGRLPKLAPGFYEGPPDLAAEVRSQHDTRAAFRERGLMWLARGVRMVWLADPHDRTVTELEPGCGPRILREGDAVIAPDLLPGFACPVALLFRGLDG